MAVSATVPLQPELLARLPSSNRPGVLRRDLLPPGETVIFETRPSFGALYWGRLTFIVLYLLLWSALAIAAPDALAGALFFMFPVLLWLILLYFQWASRVYALTDQRVIRTSGLRGSDFQDANYLQITNMTIEPGLGGGLRFDTTPLTSPGAAAKPRRVRPLRWDGLRETQPVYAFVQEAFAAGIQRANEEAARKAAAETLAVHTIPCAYCRGLIDLREVTAADPRCPRCGAPLKL